MEDQENRMRILRHLHQIQEVWKKHAELALYHRLQAAKQNADALRTARIYPMRAETDRFTASMRKQVEHLLQQGMTSDMRVSTILKHLKEDGSSLCKALRDEFTGYIYDLHAHPLVFHSAFQHIEGETRYHITDATRKIFHQHVTLDNLHDNFITGHLGHAPRPYACSKLTALGTMLYQAQKRRTRSVPQEQNRARLLGLASDHHHDPTYPQDTEDAHAREHALHQAVTATYASLDEAARSVDRYLQKRWHVLHSPGRRALVQEAQLYDQVVHHLEEVQHRCLTDEAPLQQTVNQLNQRFKTVLREQLMEELENLQQALQGAPGLATEALAQQDRETRKRVAECQPLLALSEEQRNAFETFPYTVYACQILEQGLNHVLVRLRTLPTGVDVGTEEELHKDLLTLKQGQRQEPLPLQTAMTHLRNYQQARYRRQLVRILIAETAGTDDDAVRQRSRHLFEEQRQQILPEFAQDPPPEFRFRVLDATRRATTPVLQGETPEAFLREYTEVHRFSAENIRTHLKSAEEHLQREGAHLAIHHPSASLYFMQWTFPREVWRSLVQELMPLVGNGSSDAHIRVVATSAEPGRGVSLEHAFSFAADAFTAARVSLFS